MKSYFSEDVNSALKTLPFEKDAILGILKVILFKIADTQEFEFNLNLEIEDLKNKKQAFEFGCMHTIFDLIQLLNLIPEKPEKIEFRQELEKAFDDFMSAREAYEESKKATKQ